MQNASHREAVEAIKNAGNPVVFVVQSLSSTPRVSFSLYFQKLKKYSLYLWTKLLPPSIFQYIFTVILLLLKGSINFIKI